MLDDDAVFTDGAGLVTKAAEAGGAGAPAGGEAGPGRAGVAPGPGQPAVHDQQGTLLLHTSLDRAGAERTLREHGLTKGLFLFREKGATSFVLTLCTSAKSGGTIVHHVLQATPEGFGLQVRLGVFPPGAAREELSRRCSSSLRAVYRPRADRVLTVRRPRADRALTVRRRLADRAPTVR